MRGRTGFVHFPFLHFPFLSFSPFATDWSLHSVQTSPPTSLHLPLLFAHRLSSFLLLSFPSLPLFSPFPSFSPHPPFLRLCMHLPPHVVSPVAAVCGPHVGALGGTGRRRGRATTAVCSFSSSVTAGERETTTRCLAASMRRVGSCSRKQVRKTAVNGKKARKKSVVSSTLTS